MAEKNNSGKWIIGGILAFFGINAIGKGINYKQAYDNISWTYTIKSMKIGKPLLDPSLSLVADVIITNPVKENFVIEHPDMILFYNDVNIGNNKPKMEKTTLKAKSQVVIPNIEFSTKLKPILSDLGFNIWNNWDGFAQIKTTVEKAKASILKKMKLRMMLNIDGVQINFDTPLTGFRGFKGLPDVILSNVVLPKMFE